MEQKLLFTPELSQAQKYGRYGTDLFIKLGFGSKEKLLKEDEYPIYVIIIPFVLRAIGISSGDITLLPNNIPHMIGFGQEKTNLNYKNMHNLNLYGV